MIKCLPSRLVCPHDSISSLAKNFACGWPQFIIFTSHLLIFLFYPLRGKKTLVSYLERRLLLVLVLSQYSLLCYLLLLMGKMSQNKGTKSLYILTYQASPRNISAKSLQTPGLYLSVLSELLPIQEEKNTEMRRAENNKCERWAADQINERIESCTTHTLSNTGYFTGCILIALILQFK